MMEVQPVKCVYQEHTQQGFLATIVHLAQSLAMVLQLVKLALPVYLFFFASFCVVLTFCLGSVSLNNTCVYCWENTWLSNNNCYLCDAGSFSPPNSSSCNYCPPGIL